jgi:hypothetical protein
VTFVSFSDSERSSGGYFHPCPRGAEGIDTNKRRRRQISFPPTHVDGKANNSQVRADWWRESNPRRGFSVLVTQQATANKTGLTSDKPKTKAHLFGAGAFCFCQEKGGRFLRRAKVGSGIWERWGMVIRKSADASSRGLHLSDPHRHVLGILFHECVASFFIPSKHVKTALRQTLPNTTFRVWWQSVFLFGFSGFQSSHQHYGSHVFVDS